MLFRESGDWKKTLPAEDEKRLNDIIRKTLEYRNAYKNSSEPRIAQLWCAILVMQKELNSMKSKIHRMEDVYIAITNAVNKNETDRRDLIKSLENY